MYKKQVDKAHYEFGRYMSKARWASTWHQLDEVLRLAPRSVLEIGPGSGVFRETARVIGLSVSTLDIDPELRPDYVSSVVDTGLPDGAFELVCAFQVLEHVPFSESVRALGEMMRISSGRVLISLPDAQRMWTYSMYIPKLGQLRFALPRPAFRKEVHEFDGEHHWEINKRGYELNSVVRDFERCCSGRLVRTFRVPEHPYHRFMLFERKPS